MTLATTSSKYFDTLEEYVFDENRVVTYKWLSRTLGVHINEAKEILYEFSLDSRKKNDRELNIMYFLSGLSTLPNGVECHRYKVVPEDELEEEKAALKTVKSCHIYSIHTSHLQNTDSLYITDYMAFKDDVYNYNLHGSITHPSVSLRPLDTVKVLPIPTETPQTSSKGAVTSTSGSSLFSKRPPKSGLASLFSKHTAKVSETIKKEVVDVVGGKDETINDVMKVEKKEERHGSDVCRVGDKNGQLATTQKVSKTSKNRTKTTQSSDEQCETIKRRRIKNIVESSSEGEMEEDVRSPPRMSPVRETTPEPVTEPTKVKQMAESCPTGPGDTKSGGANGKKRKRVKKLVPKTFMDHDGFMVTEKVWEMDSTDASENEEPQAKRTPTETANSDSTPPTTAPTPGPDNDSTQIKKTRATKKSSPTKTGGKQQQSIMSFFKKK